MKKTIVLLFAIFALGVWGQTTWDISNTDADNVTATLSEDRTTLIISGTGVTKGYSASSTSSIPWYSSRNNITNVIIEDGITEIRARVLGGDGLPNITSITIPNTVVTISRDAFNNSKMTAIYIPNSVTSLGDDVNGLYAIFEYCNRLTFIEVAADNIKYSSMDGVLFNKDKTILIRYPAGKGEEYTIPNSVITIRNAAFLNCLRLTSVTMGSGMTSIKDFAFEGCSNLTNVTMNAGIDTIGPGAFYECTNLMSVTIPNSVTFIGGGAFNGNGSLTSVTFGSGVNFIETGVFSRCYMLTTIISLNSVPPTLEVDQYGRTPFGTMNLGNISLYVPEGSIGLYSSANIWKDFGHILPAENVSVRPRTISSPTMFGLHLSPAVQSNGSVVIRYSLDVAVPVTFSVYNLKGNRVAHMPVGMRQQGNHSFTFRAPRGLYIVEANVGGVVVRERVSVR